MLAGSLPSEQVAPVRSQPGGHGFGDAVGAGRQVAELPLRGAARRRQAKGAQLWAGKAEAGVSAHCALGNHNGASGNNRQGMIFHLAQTAEAGGGEVAPIADAQTHEAVAGDQAAETAPGQVDRLRTGRGAHGRRHLLGSVKGAIAVEVDRAVQRGCCTCIVGD